jgi:Cof subfamily protein (haloacid dehalogenase superfamily)
MTKLPSYEAAALDLDGTLLNGSDLSNENVAAVESLKQRGVTCVIATGRNFHHATPTYKRLALSTAIVSNDGALVSTPGGAIISERLLPLAVSSDIIDSAKALGITCLSYFRHGVHTSSWFDWGPGMERHREIGRFFRISSAPLMRTKQVYKTLLFCLDAVRLDAFQATMEARYQKELDAIRNHPNVLEFITKGVSKVSGLDVLAKHLGIAPEKFLAFGDGINDRGMFVWAGLSVCMHHGHESARNAAKMVAPASDAGVNFAHAVASVLALPAVAPAQA